MQRCRLNNEPGRRTGEVRRMPRRRHPPVSFEELPPDIVKLLTDQMARISELENEAKIAEDAFGHLMFEIWNYFDWSVQADKETNAEYRVELEQLANEAWERLVERYEEQDVYYRAERKRLGERDV